MDRLFEGFKDWELFAVFTLAGRAAGVLTEATGVENIRVCYEGLDHALSLSCGSVVVLITHDGADARARVVGHIGAEELAAGVAEILGGEVVR